ncbi:MAG TPA: Rieske 2Fe-2S domain-containing protein [Lacunisphaera sp.]|nr:Rieske 2Fe-2S domain-containing protein [Lacunisphaera sp.]
MSLLETAAQPRGADRGEAQARHEDFAVAPNSWYYLGHVSEAARGPMRFELPNGQAFVAFRTAGGRFGALAARCCHMGTDLARGCVVGERLACPLHGWEFGTDGRCERIPIQAEIPAFARQASYPVEERRGHLFLFNQPEARFPLPFFADVHPDELQPARAFTLEADVPWYFVGANGFDVQHFLCAHDRVMLGEPAIDSPHPFAQRIQVRFGVAGHSLPDRMTRLVAGPEVTMTITVWCGTLVLVEARFQRTVTYGMMTVRPLPNARTLARVIVWVRRSRGPVARAAFDPLNARIRRRFIEIFLTSDIERMAGVRHNPHRLLDIDAPFARHLDWLKGIQL